jgi:hypothetical protein
MKLHGIHSVLIAAALALAATGCASKPEPTPAPEPSPGVRGPGVGIELAQWIIDDNPFDDRLKTGEAARTVGIGTLPIAEVLAPYLNRAVPVTRETRERWRANGFRLVSVPRADLDHIREKLRISGTIQQQWVGENPKWTPAFTGPHWTGLQPVGLDDGPVTLNSGALRMLMRCWVGPALGSVPVAPSLASGSIPGAVQIELTPQHLVPINRGDIAALLKPQASIEEQGVIFTRYTLECSLSTDDALLVVPDRPDAEWKAPAQDEADADIIEAPEASIGPPLPSTPSLGEVMMTDVAAGGRRNSRAVLVIQPMPPATFNLLGR